MSLTWYLLVRFDFLSNWLARTNKHKQWTSNVLEAQKLTLQHNYSVLCPIDGGGYDWRYGKLKLDGRIGGGGWFTWCQLVPLGLTWTHLDPLGLISIHLNSLQFTWTHLDSFGLTWVHLDSLEFTFTQLGSLGFTWTHWDSLGLTWLHLDPLRFTGTHLDSLGLTDFTPILLRGHLISLWFRLYRIDFTSISFDLISISLWFHFEFTSIYPGPWTH